MLAVQRRFVSLDLFRYKVLALMVIGLQAVPIVCLSDVSNYNIMAVASVVQVAFLVLVLVLSPVKQPFCIVYLVVNWVFHFGQLLCVSSGHIEGVAIDFRLYGNTSINLSAFLYAFISQSLIAAGAVVGTRPDKKSKAIEGGNSIDFDFRVGLVLFFVGLPFRLYIDASKVIAAQTLGYQGVYSLIFPATMQSVAFFCEAGALMMLLLFDDEKKRNLLFWGMCFAKIIVMSSGGRQDSFCFLIIWFLLYFVYIKALTISKGFMLAAMAILFLVLIDAYGKMRKLGFSFESFYAYLSSMSFTDVIWDSLGEFGSAFSTLVVTFTYVPKSYPFGLGLSYIAGLLSVIPGLVSHFPILKGATLYVSSLPRTTYFGGSMLGEFYYNFGWTGLAGSFVVGMLVAYCQGRFNCFNRRRNDSAVWLASILAVYLLLFVRGYFTDAVMRLVYTILAAWIVTALVRKLDSKRNVKMRARAI